MSILEMEINSPSIYSLGMVLVQGERRIANDTSLSILSLNHASYGSIDVLISLAQRRVIQIVYRQQGYTESSSDSFSFNTANEAGQVQAFLSGEITSILGELNYTEK